MKTILSKNLFLTVSLIIGQHCNSQGFVNLDFESASITNGTPTGSFIPITSALPGWTTYIGGIPSGGAFYNGNSLGGAIVGIQDVNANPYKAIQGNYSVLLQGSTASTPTSAAIGQTGQISMNVLSLVFWGYASEVSFNGLPLTLVVLGTTPNYNIYGADISAFAGQTGQLLFTAPPQNGALLDNIQFSSTAVPEPSTLALIGLGGALLAIARKRVSQT